MDLAENTLAHQVERITKSARNFGGDIKIAHSVFALPFAGSAYFLVGSPSISIFQIVMLLICMVAARSFAMGMNRYFDRDIDAINPRTMIRAIPSGRLKASESLTWALFFGALFVAASFSLSNLAGYMSLPLLLTLMSYSLFKRFSWTTHWYLGLCLGLAPVAVSVALTATIPVDIVWLGVGIALWTAGFDILYSIQDYGFDQRHELHSVPSRFGVKNSLILSRISFIGMIVCLFVAGLERGIYYHLGVALIGAILTYEQKLVADLPYSHSSKKINTAFFTVNGWVSVIFLAFVILDTLS